MINLTGNAVKFIKSGEVEVIIERADMNDGVARLRFAVRDTGIGIPADRLDRLFKSFSQVDASTSRKYGGTGLGLAISQQLIELMGGQIAVDSVMGQGSTFRFELSLPVAESASVEAAPVQPLPVCLICETCASSAAALRDSLHAAGATTSCAADEDQLRRAMELADPGRELVVLIGAVVWGPTHERLATVAREHPAARVFAITLRDHGAVEERRWRHVVDGWLSKPASASGLAGQLRSAMRGESASDALAQVQVLDPAQARGKRVLVAEDHPVGQLVTIDMLRSLGLACIVMDRGDKVVEAALREPLDLILMDGQLPHMDGFQATREIRRVENSRGGHRTPIVALTAGAMQGDRERCLEAGMDDHVTKPISRQELARAVSKSLGIPLIAAAPIALETEPLSLEAVESPSQGVAAGINVGQLLERCAGNRDIATELLTLFESSTSADLQRLADALGAADGSRVTRSAHAIAGCALQIGAESLGSLARQIEAQARVEQLHGLEQQLELLRSEFDRCLAELPRARQALARDVVAMPAPHQ